MPPRRRSPAADDAQRADRLHWRYRAFGFALASVLAALLQRAAPASAWTGLLLTALAAGGALTWWGWLLAARGRDGAFGRTAWAQPMLGGADRLMAALLVALLAAIAWSAFVRPALDALSGGGAVIDPLK